MGSRRSLSAIKEDIHLLRIKLMELEQDYRTYLYLETMTHSPTYKYCYATSNFTLKYEDQSVDAWLRAIAMHMTQRLLGHGGGFSDAVIITPPYFTNANARDNWVKYIGEKLRKKVRVRKPIVEKPKYKHGAATKLN